MDHIESLRGSITGSLLVALALLRVSTVSAGTLSFETVLVDPDPPENPWYKMLGDLDGDDRPEIIVGGQHGPLVWYQYPDWTRNLIALEGWDGVNGEAIDLDGDGDTDLVMGGVVWFENPGSAGGAWTRNQIESRKAHDIEVGDLDADGRIDVVARDQSAFGGGGSWIRIYRQMGPSRWAMRTLECPHGEGIQMGDLDADGDPDLVIAGRWFENDGDPINGAWTAHRYASEGYDPDAKVAVADLNGDGRLDIVLAPAELAGGSGALSWFEGPARTSDSEWVRHPIVAAVESVVHGLALADFDRDGMMDVAYAEMHQGADPDEVCVMRNLGNDQWQKLVLTTEGSHDIVTGDLDGDGWVDLMGANWSGPKQSVLWWRNQTGRLP